MADNEAGRLQLEVVADTRNLRRQLRDAVDAASSGISADVHVQVDASDLRRQLRDAIRIAGQGLNVRVDVEVSSADLRERLRAAIEEAQAGQRAEIPADIDVAELRRLLRQERERQQEESNRNPIRVPVKPEADSKLFETVLSSVFNAIKMPVLKLAFAVPLLQAVSALGAGFISLTSAIAPASGLILGLPAAVLGGASAMGALKLGTQGVGDAFTAVAKAQAEQDKQGKLTKAQYDSLQASLKGLAPAARSFVTEVTALGPAWTKMREAVQESLFTNLAVVTRNLGNTYIPILRGALTGVAGAFNSAAQEAAGYLSQAETTSRIGEITRNNTAAAQSFARVTAPLIDIFIRLAQVASPYLTRVADLVVRFAQYVDRAAAAGQETGRLANFFQRAWTTAETLGRIAVNVGTGIFQIFHAASWSGQPLLLLLDQLTAKFAAWTSSARGQAALETFFRNSQAPLHEIIGLLGDAAKALASFAGGGGDQLTPIITALRSDFLPAITEIVHNLTGGGLGPALAQAAVAVSQLIAALSGGGGGGTLTAFITTLTKAIEIVTKVTTSVPGASTAFTGLFAAIGVYQGVSKVVDFVKDVGGQVKEAYGQVKDAIGTTKEFIGGVRDTSSALRDGASSARQWGARIATGARTAATATWSAVRATAGWTAALARNTAAWAANIARQVAARIATIATTVAQWAARAATAAWTAIQWLFNAAMSANPIILVGLAIAALVLGIIYAYNHFSAFRAIVNAVGNALRAGLVAAFHLVAAAVDFFIGHWRLMISILLGPFGLAIALITKYWSDIRAVVVGAVTTVVNFVRSHWQLLISIILGPLGVIIALVITYWSQIVSAVRGAISAVVGAVQSGWGAVAAATAAAWNAVRGAVSGAVSGIIGAVHGVEAVAGIIGGAFQRAYNAVVSKVGEMVGYVGGIGGRIVSAVGDLGGRLYSAGVAVIQGLIDGIKHMAGEAANAAKGVVSGAIDGAKHLLHIGSPSRVFVEIGRDTVAGLVIGLEANAHRAGTAASTVVAKITEPFAPAAPAGSDLAALRAAVQATPVVNNTSSVTTTHTTTAPVVNVTLSGARQTSQEQAAAVGRETAWMMRGVLR